MIINIKKVINPPARPRKVGTGVARTTRLQWGSFERRSQEILHPGHHVGLPHNSALIKFAIRPNKRTGGVDNAIKSDPELT